MAFKKYIKRDGKLYGPYIYHSRKSNGKVITEYGGKFENEKKYLPVGIFLALLLVFSFGYFFISSDSFQNFSFGSITGLAVSDNLEETVLEPLNPIATVSLITEIVDAKHLGLDVTDEIKTQDNVWTEEISDGEYVSIRFEENLKSENDLIIYSETIFGDPKIEIEGERNEFSLKVTGGSLRIDFVGGRI